MPRASSTHTARRLPCPYLALPRFRSATTLSPGTSRTSMLPLRPTPPCLSDLALSAVSLSHLSGRRVLVPSLDHPDSQRVGSGGSGSLEPQAATQSLAPTTHLDRGGIGQTDSSSTVLRSRLRPFQLFPAASPAPA